MSLTFVALLTSTLTVTSIIIGFILVGICCAYQILAIYKVSTYVPDNLAGLATAIANMIIMSFGYFFHSSIGIILKYMGDQGVKTAYTYAIGIIPLTLIMGAIGFFKLKKTENKS